MKEKALQNLDAAKFLRDRRLMDACASRVYYAAFQATSAALAAQGKYPHTYRKDATEWRHGELAEAAWNVRGCRGDKEMLEEALALREQADYRPEPVDPAELKIWMREVEAYMSAVLQ